MTMTDFEEETYSTVFTSLRHPIRRKILRTLSAGPQNFSDLQRAFDIESSHLTYHLEGLGNLLLKTADGKYTLSSLGKTAVSMMRHVEEPPNIIPLHVSLSPKKWKLLVVALTMGIILLSVAFCFEYQNLSLPNNQSSSLLNKYIVSGSVTTALATRLNETSELSEFKVTSFIMSTLGNARLYSFRSLADNSTLEIEMQVPASIEQGAGISLTVYADTIHPTVAYVGSLSNDSDPLSFNASQLVVEWAHSYDMIWSGAVTDRNRFSVLLPEAGSYYLLIEGPLVWIATDYHAIDYTITLQIQYQGYYVPFSFGSEQESFSVFFPPF
jgi:DNA-binding transcriptional ArsR family regulator